MGNELVEGKYYRVRPITTFDVLTFEYKDLPLKEGLAIDEKQEDGKYKMIASVEPDKLGIPEFHSIHFRAIDTLDPKNIEKLDEYLNCVNFAKDVLLDFLKDTWERGYED